MSNEIFSVATAGVASLVAARLAYVEAPRRIVLAVTLALVAAAIADAAAPSSFPFARDVLLGGCVAWAIDDATTGLIHHRLTIPLAICTLILGSMQMGPLTAIAGAVLLVACFALMKLAFRRSGGMGGGDVMASISIGATLGPQLGGIAIASGLLIALVITAIFVGFRIVERGARLRLGPYLALGCAIAAALPDIPFIYHTWK